MTVTTFPPKPAAWGKMQGRRGRRARALVQALWAGRLSAVGSKCPYRKRAYVAAWRHGVAERRGMRSALPWTPGRLASWVRSLPRRWRSQLDPTVRRTHR